MSVKFFDFSDGHDDAHFESMHHTQKISAKEYMQTHSVDHVLCVQALDALDYLVQFSKEHKEVDALYEDVYEKSMQKVYLFVITAGFSNDFSDMRSTFYTLINIFKDHKLLHASQKSHVAAQTLLLAMVHDLHTWIKTLFIEQSTHDIYYFDASFASSVMQLESLLDEGDV